MSHNQSFYNNFPGNSTFQGGAQPPFYMSSPPPLHHDQNHPIPEINDQEFVKTFESKIVHHPVRPYKPVAILDMRNLIRTLMVTIIEIQNDEKRLRNEIETLSEEEWRSIMETIDSKKTIITDSLRNISNSHLDLLRKHLAKRSAKRTRLRRMQLERKKEKEDRMKKLQERSLKIDENLQKIKDDILKAKQEEESKLHADIVLKEVLKKKHDAKKSISKLDSLMKLRKARVNTAKGSGQTVSKCETEAFVNKIENLKSLWIKKLSSYEVEESELLNKLQRSKQNESSGIDLRELEVEDTLGRWRKMLFGGKQCYPQVDFGGDFNKFVAVRSQWDKFIDNEGTTIPIGWVLSKTGEQ